MDFDYHKDSSLFCQNLSGVDQRQNIRLIQGGVL